MDAPRTADPYHVVDDPAGVSVCYGILDTSHQFRDRDFYDRLFRITLNTTVHFSGCLTIHCRDSMDDLLRRMSDDGGDLAVLQAPGHIFTSRAAVRSLGAYVRRIDEFLVAGHILDREPPNREFYQLHHQILIVSLVTYRRLGCPAFGMVAPGDSLRGRRTVRRAARSPENFHDDYTPHWLRPGDGNLEVQEVQNGWHFLHASLENDLPVLNIERNLRKYKVFAYPERGTEKFRDRIKAAIPEPDREMLRMEQKYLDALAGIAADERKPIFLFNNEGLYRLETGVEIRFMAGVCSGFKLNYIMETNGFRQDATVLYYDFSRDALKFRRALHESWDGRDYPAFVRRWVADHPEAPIVEHQLENVEDGWKKELAVWEKRFSFEDHWSRFRRLEARYLEVDGVEEPEKLASAIPNDPSSVLWWSNIFFTIQLYCRHGSGGMARRYEAWRALLKEHCPEAYCMGFTSQRKRLGRRVQARDLSPEAELQDAIKIVR